MLGLLPSWADGPGRCRRSGVGCCRRHGRPSRRRPMCARGSRLSSVRSGDAGSPSRAAGRGVGTTSRAAADVLLLDATGRDHPRRAGFALHLGATLDLPTVGVTHRPLLATGDWPSDEPGATSPLTIGGQQVAAWIRSRQGTRPLVVHPGWRVGVDAAVEVVRASLAGHRTPEPLRIARQAARRARAAGVPTGTISGARW